MLSGLSTKNFFAEDMQTVFAKKCDNGVQIYCKTIFLGENFVDHQQDIINDFIGNLVEPIDAIDNPLIDDLKKLFESSLQELNANLETFAAKASDIGYFPIKGICWVIYQETLMASLIGDVSLMVVRQNKFHYTLHNDVSTTKIDIFSDFIEGELDLDDQLIFLGTNYKNVLHKQDLKDIQDILARGDILPLELLYQILQPRVADIDIGCILSFHYGQKDQEGIHRKKSKKYTKLYETISSSLQHFLFKNKYSLIAILLGCIVLILGYNVVMDMFATQENIPIIETEQGTEPVTINSIKLNIHEFENLEITSPEKAKKYKQIKERIAFLEEQHKRPEDVAALKKLIQNKYDAGFKVVYMNTSDIQAGDTIKTSYTFSQQEQGILGEPISLLYKDAYFVGGGSGAIIGGVSDDIKGTPVSYNIESNVKGCSFELSKQGLYCFTDTNQILRVTKGGVQTVKIQNKQEIDSDPASIDEIIPFDNPIVDIEVFGKNNFYVLHNNITANAEGKYITRYVNVPGKYESFQAGMPYKIIGENSGKNLGFTDMGIDKTFLTRSPIDKTLYQIRRDNTVNARSIGIQGGEDLEDAYSTNVKTITMETSKYVYLFDKDKQTLTTYKSSPLKTNEKFQYSYNLIYVFRFKFDFPASPILDITIPPETGEKPYMYVLTKNGIYQINLTDFIRQYDK